MSLLLVLNVLLVISRVYYTIWRKEFLHNSLRIRIKLRFLPKFLPEGMSPDNKYCAFTCECLSKFAIDNRTDNIVSRTL